MRRQVAGKCDRCGGPRFKVSKTGDAYPCDCSPAEPCKLCEGRGWREIAGESVKCVCSGGPDLQNREFPAHTRARAGDRPTSRAAAAAVSPRLSANQWQVYHALVAAGPSIHQKLVKAIRERGYDQSSSGIRTRTAELVEIGLVKDSGRTAKTEAGFNAVVWEAVSMTQLEVAS